MHLHQHTRAAHALKSANMVSANMVSILPNLIALKSSLMRNSFVGSSSQANYLERNAAVDDSIGGS